MTFIMLDHVLGEYDFAVKVGAVDFVGEDDYDADVSWTPLSQLPPCLMPSGPRPWATPATSRNGRAAVGRAGAGIQLRRGRRRQPVDDPEGDAETGGSDEGVVAVNLAANAVAMRADLPTRSPLDLAVPDSAALAAVQNLQEQAATLLQLPQLGMLPR